MILINERHAMMYARQMKSYCIAEYIISVMWDDFENGDGVGSSKRITELIDMCPEWKESLQTFLEGCKSNMMDQVVHYARYGDGPSSIFG